MKKILWIALILIFVICIILITPLVFSAQDKNGQIECYINFENTYTKCEHKTTFKTLKKEVFNNRDNIKEVYPSWEIKSVDEENIFLHKEIDNFCKDHYKAVLTGNKVSVYYLSNNTMCTSFYIPLKYLSEEDLNELQKGRILNSKEELTAFTEDFTS